MNVGFIAVNYKNYHFTLKYVDSILKLDKKIDTRAYIVIVDNNSGLEEQKKLMASIDAIESQVDFKILLEQENSGYFGGLNRGIQYLNGLSIDFDFTIVGNNDLEFERNFLSELENYSLTSETLAIAPNVITEDGVYQNPHVINRVSWMRRMFYYLYCSNYWLGKGMMGLLNLWYRFKPKYRRSSSNKMESRQFISMGIGAIYILPRTFFNKFNLLWDLVFLYGEEAIFAGQIRSVNGKMLYDPKLIVYHAESAATGKLSSRKRYNVLKDSYKIYRKYL